MIEKLTDLPRGVDGLKASGKVSKEDYETIVEPLLDTARREGRRMRLLYQLGPEFEGFSPGGAWEDAKIGLRSLRLFDGCAIVTDVGWIRESARLARFMMPCPVRIFGNGERSQAAEWLGSLPMGAVSHHLIEQAGVLVVEVREAFRAQDFDALALTVDSWLEGHGELQGIVIHSREFPGWENLGSLIRHVRFVRDYHRKVKRLALSADSQLASLAPRLAEHFVAAEVKSFPYESLQDAIAWAASKSTPRSTNAGTG